MNLKDQILTRKQAAEDYLVTKRDKWDTYEKLFHNSLADTISSDQKSQVFDPKMATLLIERCYRVMGQLPVGKVRGVSKDDEGTSKLMNLILDKYIIPNANSQFDFLTKLRMIDLYSNLYGSFYAMVDWNVGRNGYVGPDMWLLNIRDVFPQVGAVSIEDSDYVIVRTWRPISYFENLAKDKNYKNIDKIIKCLKQKTGSKTEKDSQSESQRESEAYPSGSSAKHSGYFEILTQYEKDRWVDFCVDAGMEFRDQKNPHDDNELPVYGKYSIPLIDDIMGMGDMERGASMQNVVNSIWNLYLDGVKMSMFPPTLVNKDNIAAMSSIRWGAGAKWLVRGQINNAIQPVNLNPKGTETFNNTYQVATGSLLNTNGTTDTAVTQDAEAGYGRTPQALKMQHARENTRDQADRFYMEQFIKKVCKKFIDLTIKKMTSSTVIRLFHDEIQELIVNHPEVEKLYDKKTGKLYLNKKHLNSTLYDYEIISGSSYLLDKQEQQAALLELIKTFMKNPDLKPMVEQEGYRIKMGEVLKSFISSMGLNNWNKIIEEKTDEEIADEVLDKDANAFAQAIQQAQGINAVPSQPGMTAEGMPPGLPVMPGELPPEQQPQLPEQPGAMI
jgi:hypothetical protein